MPTTIYTLILLIYGIFAINTLLSFEKLNYVLLSLGACFLAAVVFVSLVYLYAKKIKRYDIIDAAWGPTFIVVCFTSYFLAYSNIDPISICLLVVLLVTVWGVRLAWHIGKRKLKSHEEDPRYVELRRNWKGDTGLNVYLRIYLVQALLATIICIPVIHINLFNGSVWTIFTWVGLVVWAIGFICEVVADRQLKKFLENTKNIGTIMQNGLWKYSRHPNYFGEITQWWGIGIIAAGVLPWWVGLIGPITITYLILFISGIPPTEKRFEGRPGWDEYKKKTSVLLPLPSKKV